MVEFLQRTADGRDYQHDDAFRRTAVAQNTTISEGQQIIGCTAHSITVTLASAMVDEGSWVIVKDESGAAGGVGQAITIATEAAETVDGSASLSLADNHAGAHLYSDGTNWFTSAGVGSVL